MASSTDESKLHLAIFCLQRLLLENIFNVKDNFYIIGIDNYLEVDGLK